MKSWLFVFIHFLAFVNGFTPVKLGSIHKKVSLLKATLKNDNDDSAPNNLQRRKLLEISFQLAFFTQIGPQPSIAVVQGEKVLPPLQFEEAEIKFREGYKTINYLLDNYDEICEGGGDNVRRYLGTIVGKNPSGLVGIGKVMKALQDRADDFIEFTETSEEVIKSINQADGSAYMAIFVTTSTSYTPPKKYFDDGKIEVKRCKQAMEQIAAMVDIKL